MACNSDLSDKMIKLYEIVSDDSLLSQKGIELKLETNNVTLSQSAISKNLKKTTITRYRIKKISTNSSINIAVPVRKKIVSILVLISNSGILYHKIAEGSINSLLFVEFFEECLRMASCSRVGS